MAEELARHGYKISPGTLYPTLHGMEEGLLKSEHRRTLSGRARGTGLLTQEVPF